VKPGNGGINWGQIDRIRPPVGDAPPDSFTVAEYAGRYTLPERTARGQLFALVRAGKLQAGTKRVVDSSGRCRQVRAFWIPKGVGDLVHGRRRGHLRAAQFRSVRKEN
jgi:hypothetical protein